MKGPMVGGSDMHQSWESLTETKGQQYFSVEGQVGNVIGSVTTAGVC